MYVASVYFGPSRRTDIVVYASMHADAKRIFAEVFPRKILQLNAMLDGPEMSMDRVNDDRGP